MKQKIECPIKTIREEMDLPGEKFANLCGVSKSTLYKIETGERLPSDKFLEAFCSFTDTPKRNLVLRMKRWIESRKKNDLKAPDLPSSTWS